MVCNIFQRSVNGRLSVILHVAESERCKKKLFEMVMKFLSLNILIQMASRFFSVSRAMKLLNTSSMRLQE